MKFLKKVHEPQSEIIRNYRVEMKNQISRFGNNHVKRYISACFDQAVAYTETYLGAPPEISPLIGFYAMLNLAKVQILLKNGEFDTSINSVTRLFSSHGASSDGVEKIAFRRRGTFVELASLYCPDYLDRDTVTLNWLYRNTVDLHDLYKRIYRRESNYISLDFHGTMMG